MAIHLPHATCDLLMRRALDNNYVSIDNKMGSLFQGPIYSIPLTTTNLVSMFPSKDELYLTERYKFKILIR